MAVLLDVYLHSTPLPPPDPTPIHRESLESDHALRGQILTLEHRALQRKGMRIKLFIFYSDLIKISISYENFINNDQFLPLYQLIIKKIYRI